MARHDQAAALLKSGRSPAKTAKELGISVSSVAQYLYTAVGRGLICRSDILFTIEDDVAGMVESMLEHHSIRNRWELQRVLRADSEKGVHWDDVDEAMLYFDLREAPLADMYELLCRLERFLHGHIRLTLE